METLTTLSPAYDVSTIRTHFPILKRQLNGKPLVYLDNAATSQKPQVVLDALVHYYSHYNANIHRGIHTLAEEATAAYESTRQTVKEFIGARQAEEIIFTRGATEGINLVAFTWGRQNIGPGDEILISEMEHHSNIVPWQMLCEEKKAVLKVIPITEKGELDMDAYRKLLSSRTKIVAVVHVSNSLGTVNPVKTIIEEAHRAGALVLIDGAQSTVHLDIDVQEMDCDFFAFSGHKVYGPTGIGVLYGKKNLLDSMPPFMGGGEMIKEVTFKRTTYSELPYKYEAGTPNIADTVALKSALDYVRLVGKEAVRSHESALLEYATQQLESIPQLKIMGRADNKVSVISFVIDGLHPQDLGVLLDNQGIAVRTGHHCTQPLMDHFKIPGTVRASFAMYNTIEEMDRLFAGLQKAVKMLL